MIITITIIMLVTSKSLDRLRAVTGTHSQNYHKYFQRYTIQQYHHTPTQVVKILISQITKFHMRAVTGTHEVATVA